MEKQLSKNWVLCKIEDIADVTSGIGFPINFQGNSDNMQIPFYKVGDISQTFLRKEVYLSVANNYVTDEIRKELNGKLLPAGTLVFAKIGEALRLNRRAIISIPSLCDNNVMGVIPFSMDMYKFLYYYFNTIDLGEFSAGNSVPSIRKSSVLSLSFPLPPLPEQNRIVTKLDVLFAQLEAIKSSMTTVPLLLKNFRQQVLTQAVTGKLTEEWRKGKELEDMFNYLFKISEERRSEYEKQVVLAKKAKLRKPKKDFEFDFKKHPTKENWCIAKLDNLVYMSARIGWKGLKAEEYTEAGPLFISVHSLNYGENVNYEKAYHISEDRFLESPEIMLEENDILLCKDGAGIGKLGIVKNLKEKATVNSSLLVIRGKETLNSKFLFYFFSGPTLQNIAKERITGTAIPHLFQRDIREFYFEIPPLEEQQEIVSRVESLFAKADYIEQQYKFLKAKIESLPQALLHKAFKGELTEQLESDGDARELLKEINKIKESKVKIRPIPIKKASDKPANRKTKAVTSTNVLKQNEEQPVNKESFFLLRTEQVKQSNIFRLLQDNYSNKIFQFSEIIKSNKLNYDQIWVELQEILELTELGMRPGLKQQYNTKTKVMEFKWFKE